ncbi:APC family permease [Singulisphaera sp. PoT]|uniref:APC family permease n=1 Tax=Singulisphaera sp. PoT TaxID=3411797 RepID=UPI003BF4BB60
MGGSIAKGTDQAGSPLARGLGFLDATMIVMGSMIGSGIFVTPAESARLVGSPGWLLAAWALTGLMTVSGSLCCAEVTAMMPRAGGQYVFLREAYGPAVGFLFGWSFFLVVQTGAIAAVSVAFAKYLGVFVPWVSASNVLIAPIAVGHTGYAISLTTEQLFAVALILGLAVANTRGLGVGRWIQNPSTIAKTLALAALIVVGLAVGLRSNAGAAAWASSWWKPAPGTFPTAGAIGPLAMAMVLGRAMIGPLFSQTSWNNVTFLGAETRNPEWTLPRALVVGCGSVVTLYLLANVAYIVTLPLSGIQHPPEDRVGTAMLAACLGPAGAYAMAAAILVSTFGCVNGSTLAGARVSYAMARDGLFFRQVGTVNARRVPALAILAQGAWASLLALTRTVTTDPATGATTFGNVYNQLLEYLVSVDLFFYVLLVGTVVILRRRAPGAARPFRTPLYPLPAIVYIGLATLLIVDLVYLAPTTSGMGFAIALAGLPVYAVWSRLGTAVEEPSVVVETP